jgi:hypothetical protein
MISFFSRLADCVDVSPKPGPDRSTEYEIFLKGEDIEYLVRLLVFRKGLKSVYKSSLKYLPIIGWSWVFSENVFLKRNWNDDKVVLAKSLKDILNYPKGYKYAVSHGFIPAHSKK